MSSQASQALYVTYYLFWSYASILLSLYPRFDEIKVVINDENCSIYSKEQKLDFLRNKVLPETKPIFNPYISRDDASHILCGKSLDAMKLPIYNFSEEFIKCEHVLIDPDGYRLLLDGSIYIEEYSKTYTSTNYFIRAEGVYVCSPQVEESGKILYFDTPNFPKVFDSLTFAGLVISILSLLLHQVLFCLFPELRNLSGYYLASLGLSLLMVYLCVLTNYILELDKGYTVLGVYFYYFLLSTLFWMSSITGSVWKSFRISISKTKLPSRRASWRNFLYYSFYSWGTPAVFAFLGIMFDSTNILPPEYRPSFGDPICWSGERKALLIYFMLPSFILFVLNVACLMNVVHVITLNYNTYSLENKYFIYLWGLTWLFNTVTSFIERIYVWYMFTVFNSLQGIFLFIAFIVSSKIYNRIFKKYRRERTVFTVAVSL